MSLTPPNKISAVYKQGLSARIYSGLQVHKKIVVQGCPVDTHPLTVRKWVEKAYVGVTGPKPKFTVHRTENGVFEVSLK